MHVFRIFQQVTGLRVTGRPDSSTLAMMRAARCGLSDPFSHTLKYRTLGQWSKKRLTYRIYNHPLSLGLSGTRAAVRAAFGYWSAVSPLHFQEVSRGHADIKLSFHRRNQGCSVAFDGPGQVLGHAEGPESGTVHFDADEVWTEGRSSGANLRIIAAHEIGHALGLGHSQYHSALMGPVYTGYRHNFRLHQDDIRGIQTLYGKNMQMCFHPVFYTKARSTTGPLRRGTGRHDAGLMSLCFIFSGPLHKTLAFRGHYVWTLSDSGYNSPIHINALWKELPSNINAAVHSQRTSKSYFLKGDKVWRYSGFKLDQGYPKRLTIPSNIQAAFFLRSHRALVFIKSDCVSVPQGSEYWLWDELRSAKHLQLKAALPSDLDAAFTGGDGRVHVFSGAWHWRLSPTLTPEKGYPHRSRHRWMHCDH
ncbi:matrix metalloproteinase-19-like [Carassius carassius]|uniref:matrix metalloproteinase-19-like n=1 Tax=Carassius carassius TaxID=217509 RepID=UPI002868E780|nr:matrix metalloproteinase-19-like [Carassius carassius]